MDKSNDENERPLVTPNTTDDESLTTSTTSGSWTLVTEKKTPKTTITPRTHEEESNIEDLPKYEDLNLETSETTVKEEQEDEPSPEHHNDTASVTDEFSDEVSIISESENGDALTPHPYLREHLKRLNLKFTTGEGLDFATIFQQQQQEENKLKHTTPPNTPIQLLQPNSSNQIKQRKRSSPSIVETQKKLITTQQDDIQAEEIDNINSPSLLQRLNKILFYSMIALSILGIYGKLFANKSQLLSHHDETNINELEKKMIDIELQNNLMRAEIDLLSKQVNYLKTENSNLNGNRNDKRYEYQSNKEKKHNLRDKRNNINREQIWRNQRNTENHEYVMDVEGLENIEINIDLSTDDSKSKPSIVKFNEDIPTTTENKPEEASTKNDNNYDDDDDDIDDVLKERFRKIYKKDKREYEVKNEEKYKKQDENDKKFKRNNKKFNSKERFDNDDSKHDNHDSKEHKRFKKDSKERSNDKNNSKERKYKRDDNETKRYNKHNSKEEYRNENENFKKYNSKKENQHQRYRERYNDEHSKEWHEKVMQREKNWFLKHGDSREQLRFHKMNRR